MIGIKVNLLKDSLERIDELIELVGEPCTIELFTEPRLFEKQGELAAEIRHPLLERVVVHTATDVETRPSDALANPSGFDNCLKQLEIVPEGGDLLLHPFGCGLAPEKRWKSLEEDAKATSQLADEAEKRGVGILKENIPPGFPFPHGRSAEDMEELTRHPNVSLCLDMSHQGMAQSRSESGGGDDYFREEWKRYLPHYDIESFLSLGPRYFHVADHRGWKGEGLEIGDGERDWSVMKRLEGVFVLEIRGQHENGFKAWKRNLERLRALLG